MATGWKGVALGALALTALDLAVGGTPGTDQQASAHRVGGLFTGAATLARRFISPELAAIPPKADTNGGASTPTTSPTVTPAVAASPYPSTPPPTALYGAVVTGAAPPETA